jgi:ubiquinol-cytochrome c reductase cytochrome c1 subunit
MNRIFLVVGMAVLALFCRASLASGSQFRLEVAGNDVANVASLQRGARNFINYCMGCHSAKYVRYNRLARDLQITEDQLVNNLMFVSEQPHETMNIAMPPADAQRWFGQAPPDLTLIARSKGTDYLYTFLKSFYIDESKPTGVNNLVLDGASMPHVLWQLQGLQKANFEEEEHNGAVHIVFQGFEQVVPGDLTTDEYDQFVRDLVNFLEYVGEPMQLERRSLGVWVLVFLLVFGVFSYLLKVEIWKDVK